MKRGKGLFFSLTLLELSYVDMTVDMKWKWLKHKPDAFERFKIGLARGWKITNFKWRNVNYKKSYWRKYHTEIVDLLCEESCWSNHSKEDIRVNLYDLVSLIIRSGCEGPLKFIDWKYIDDWDFSEFRPWSEGILKQNIPYKLRKELGFNKMHDWVEEDDSIEVYKADPSPRVCVIGQGESVAVAWYNDFLSSSWVFYLEDPRDILNGSGTIFPLIYINFLEKHNALYMLLYDLRVEVYDNWVTDYIKKIRKEEYTCEVLEREKKADPKRYELWKKHFGEING